MKQNKIWTHDSIGYVIKPSIFRICADKIVYSFSRFKENKTIVSISVALIFSLPLLYLLLNNTIEIDKLQDNARYFFSSASQCIAALVALVLAIYALSLSRIPNYEVIFGNFYPQICEKYFEFKLARKLVGYAGLVILSLLISIILIISNNKFLSFLIFFNAFFTISFLWIFIFFISDFLITTNKEKFFKDCRYLLTQKADYVTTLDVSKRISNFLKNPQDDMYKEIYLDEKLIRELQNEIIERMGNLLLDEDMKGDDGYFEAFKEILEETLKIKKNEINKFSIYQVTFSRLLPNFKKHVTMCLNDKRFKSCIPDMLSIFNQLIDGFNRSFRNILAENYITELGNIIIILNKDKTCQEYAHRTLLVVAESISICGLYNADFLINTMNKAKITKKEQLEILEYTLRKYNQVYGDAKDDEDYLAIIDYYDIDISVESLIRDKKFMTTKVKEEIAKLKKAVQ